MVQISDEKYKQLLEQYINAHIDDYTPQELHHLRYYINHISSAKLIPSTIRQIYDELGFLDDQENIYLGFLQLIQNNFDINRDIIEIGGGSIPSLAKKIALKQKRGTITVYDPKIIQSFSTRANLILKKELFTAATPLNQTSLIIGFMPCDATPLLIDTACRNNIDFIVALCEGGRRTGYEWLEYDDEWISHMKYNATNGIAKASMGELKLASLEKYGDPYPVIYNKRLKS